MDDKEQTTNIEEVSIDTKETSVEPANEQSEQDALISDLQAQVSELNDKFLRSVAELENTRRRLARDTESATRSTAISIVRNFLPVMDAIDAALKHSPDDAGIKSMSMAMETAFNNAGITKIESVGKQLNPQYHNVIQVIESGDDKTASNTILQEMQTGYMFGDTVLRSAMVIVSK
ncbi:MAG: nucleotide exchange factor GrpE [Alphaproteobacteria bacterium]